MRANGIADGQIAEPRPGCELVRLVDGTAMNQIYVKMAPGAAHPMHSHPNEQIGHLLRGALTVRLESGEERVLEAGDSYQVDAGVRHDVRNHTDEPVESIEVFSPPREFEYWDE